MYNIRNLLLVPIWSAISGITVICGTLHQGGTAFVGVTTVESVTRVTNHHYRADQINRK